MDSETPRRPLDGYTVVDRAGTVATAICGQLFADFGARVVNLEGAAGHPSRGLPPHAEGEEALERSALHALLSPSKESLRADSREAGGILVRADVVLDTPESMEPRPDGLQVVISWFGLTGPDAGRPATDQTVCCEIGLVKGIGRPEGPPVLPSGYPIQILGGRTAFVAAMGPLISEILTGRPVRERIDVSLLEAAMVLTEPGPVAFFNGGQPLPRLGFNRFVPTFPGGIFAASDGHIGVTALTPAQWKSLCELVGHPEHGDEPRFQAALGRLLAADEIVSWLAPALREQTAEHWFHTGQARRIPMALVPTVREVLDSEQLAARGAFRTIDSPTLGSLRVPAAPFRMPGSPARGEGAVARLGVASEGEAVPREPSPSRMASPRTPLREPTERPSWLRGLRVLDLTMGWAGPLAVRHLGDQGAEIIKIESTRHFDWWRGWDATPEALAEQIHEKSHAFNTVNRNKQGIALDLEHPRGAELFLELVRRADVVVENYSAGVMDKLGLDYSSLSDHNPRLVMLSMPPFGAGGPYHEYRGYGSTVEQASGLPHLNGEPGDPPTMLHVALGDPVAGVTGAAALLLAVLHQQRSGEGQLVDLSQVEAMSGLGLHALADTVLGREPERLGNRHRTCVPNGLYRCSGEDRWAAISVESDAQWAALCEQIGDPELVLPAYRTAAGRREAHDAIDERLGTWTAARESAEVARELCAAGIPAASVLDMDEVLTHEQLLDRGFWHWIERAVVGVQPHPGSPYRAGPEPYGIDGPAPTLGEHGRFVLAEILGLGDAELDELERLDVIGTVPQAADRSESG